MAGTTITTWTLIMEVKSGPIRDHQPREDPRMGFQQRILHRWKSQLLNIENTSLQLASLVTFRKFEEKLAKDFPLRADGQKTTLELVRLAELRSLSRRTPPSFS